MGGSSQDAQRKAWNDAMRTAAGASALPVALQPRTQKRRSDRRKKQDRRDKARKVHSIHDDNPELIAAIWMDALEDVNTSTLAGNNDDDDDYNNDDDDDFYNDTIIEDNGGGHKNNNNNSSSSSGVSNNNNNKRKRNSSSGGGSGSNNNRKGGSSKKKTIAGVLPKRFRPRSLASILLEEVNREDGVAREFIQSEARCTTTATTTNNNNITTTETNNNTSETNSKNIIKQQHYLQTYRNYPPRKYCPVTGMEGIYIEPKSGIPYANLKALEQIRERPPPWMTLNGSGAYYEAVKSIRGED